MDQCARNCRPRFRDAKLVEIWIEWPPGIKASREALVAPDLSSVADLGPASSTPGCSTPAVEPRPNSIDDGSHQ